MTKKEYMKPEIQDMGILEESDLLAYSVQSSGLDGEDLTEDETPGNAWDDAMSRHKNDWDEE